MLQEDGCEWEVGGVMGEQDDHQPLRCARRVVLPNGEMDLCPLPVPNDALTDVRVDGRVYVGRFCAKHRKEVKAQIEEILGAPILEEPGQGRWRRGDLYRDAHGRVWQMPQIRRLLARNRSIIAEYTERKLCRRGRIHNDLLEVFQKLAANEVVQPHRYDNDLDSDWPDEEE